MVARLTWVQGAVGSNPTTLMEMDKPLEVSR